MIDAQVTVKGGVEAFPETRVTADAISRSTLSADQIAYAISVALNWSGYYGVEEGKAHLRRSLSRVREHTLRVYAVAEKATRNRLSVRIVAREFPGKGTAAHKYLQVLQQGGARRAKRTERALRALGVIKADEFVVPAAGGSIAAAGNGTRVGGLHTQLIEAFRSSAGGRPEQRPAGSLDRAKRGAKRPLSAYRAGNVLFVRTRGRDPKPQLAVVSQPTYRKLISLPETVASKARDAWPDQIEEAIRIVSRQGRKGDPPFLL